MDIIYQSNLCKEIVLTPTGSIELSNATIKKDCIYPYDVRHMSPSNRFEHIHWAVEAFGIDNIDILRPGSTIYFKYESDRTLFIMKCS